MTKLFDEIPVLEDDSILLRRVGEDDAAALEDLKRSDIVYRYEPTFLFERNHGDARSVIAQMYGDCFTNRESLILGVFEKGGGPMCGLAEFYGFKDSIHKTCLGYRLRRACWGRGVATRAVALMVDYLFNRTDIEIITASTMPQNRASARVLEKNGFIRTASNVPEDWGYAHPTPADKWFR